MTPKKACNTAKPVTTEAIARLAAHVMMRLGPLLVASYSVAAPPTAHFPSGDHKPNLVAYFFEPPPAAPHPAIVLRHGRAVPYSAAANGVYAAETLSKRHQQWGQF